MTTTIRLTSNFNYPKTGSSEMVLPESVSTMIDLLRHIGEEIDFVLLDAVTEELRPDIEVILNGKEIWFYPGGLNARIKEGDAVDIALIPLGGG